MEKPQQTLRLWSHNVTSAASKHFDQLLFEGLLKAGLRINISLVLFADSHIRQSPAPSLPSPHKHHQSSLLLLSNVPSSVSPSPARRRLTGQRLSAKLHAAANWSAAGNQDVCFLSPATLLSLHHPIFSPSPPWARCPCGPAPSPPATKSSTFFCLYGEKMW